MHGCKIKQSIFKFVRIAVLFLWAYFKYIHSHPAKTLAATGLLNPQMFLKRVPSSRTQKQVRPLLSQRAPVLMQKAASLEVYALDEKHESRHSVLTCSTIFVQTLNVMCLGAEIVHLYEHFVFHGTSSHQHKHIFDTICMLFVIYH